MCAAIRSCTEDDADAGSQQDFRFKLLGLEHEKVVADGKYEAWIHPDGGSDDTDANGYTAGFFGHEW
jgi:hypothetical protein